MKNPQQSSHFFSSFAVKAVLLVLISASGLSIYPASGENPWVEGGRPLIDEVNVDKTDENTWSEKQKLEGAIDESKYPPLEEDKTLGTGFYDDRTKNLSIKDAPSASTVDSYQSFDPQSLGEIPVYPGSNQRSLQGQYGNIPQQRYRQGYQQGYQQRYQPGYQSGYWPGNSGMGGYPFGGNSTYGFPFGGNSGSFPFGMGNGWMPNSGSGFW